MKTYDEISQASWAHKGHVYEYEKIYIYIYIPK